VECRPLPADERRRRVAEHRAPEAELPVNRWIIGEVVETLAKLDKAFAELRFDDMADAIYHSPGAPSATGMSSW
jgi:valyl-tRNA synthetase